MITHTTVVGPQIKQKRKASPLHISREEHWCLKWKELVNIPAIFNKYKKAAPKPETLLCPGELQREWSLSSKIGLNNLILAQFISLLTNEMSFPIFQVGQSCAPGIYRAWEQINKYNQSISNSTALQCRVPYLYCFFT